MALTKEEQKKLEHSGYRFVGEHGHAATKICHWQKKSILNQGVCYKEKFYGIDCHRCLQLSPSVPFCSQKCSFCWRDLSLTKTEWEGDCDDPSVIIDGAIEAQKKLLCGFWGNDKADPVKLKESEKPNNAAISLAGEPTYYPFIDDLIGEFNHRNFNTFLVSNGMNPNKLKSFNNEPDQLYVSLDAPNEEVYNKVCNPQLNDGWNRLKSSLEILNSYNSRTCLRVTCVKGMNMLNPEEYAKLIDIANPTYIEVKAYMHVGYSRKRLSLDNMPEFSDVIDFANSICEYTGQSIINESEISRVVLLE